MSTEGYQQKQIQKLKQQQRHSNTDTDSPSGHSGDGGCDQRENGAAGSNLYEQQYFAEPTAVPRSVTSTITTASLQPLPPPPPPPLTALSADTAHSGSISTATMAAAARAPPVTEQIANLLNLSQNLLYSVREQQQLTQRQRQRRHYRPQATTPYQRPTGIANHAPENGNANRNSNANDSGASISGNGGASGAGVITNGAEGLQLDETQFCSCIECLARRLRRGIISTATASSSANGVVGNEVATAAADYMQRQYSGNHSSSSSRANQHNGGRRKHRHRHRHRHRHHRSSSSNNAGSESNNFQCSICLDCYMLHRPTVTQCGHIFCRHCIMKCVSCQGKCPMCNCKLNSSNVFRVYF